MNRNADQNTNVVHLNLTSAADRSRLHDLLNGIQPGAPVRLTVSADDTAPATRPQTAPASYADAMREVEATYYNVA